MTPLTLSPNKNAQKFKCIVKHRLDGNLENKLQDKYEEILNLLTAYIEKRSQSKLTLSKDKLRCMLDHLLEISRNQGPKMTEGDIATESLMLFTESIEALTATCEMGLLIACKYPHIQEIVYNEMKHVFTGYQNTRDQRAMRWKHINEKRKQRLLTLEKMQKQDSVQRQFERNKNKNNNKTKTIVDVPSKHARFQTSMAAPTTHSTSDKLPSSLFLGHHAKSIDSSNFTANSDANNGIGMAPIEESDTDTDHDHGTSSPTTKVGSNISSPRKPKISRSKSQHVDEKIERKEDGEGRKTKNKKSSSPLQAQSMPPPTAMDGDEPSPIAEIVSSLDGTKAQQTLGLAQGGGEFTIDSDAEDGKIDDNQRAALLRPHSSRVTLRGVDDIDDELQRDSSDDDDGPDTSMRPPGTLSFIIHSTDSENSSNGDNDDDRDGNGESKEATASLSSGVNLKEEESKDLESRDEFSSTERFTFINKLPGKLSRARSSSASEVDSPKKFATIAKAMRKKAIANKEKKSTKEDLVVVKTKARLKSRVAKRKGHARAVTKISMTPLNSRFEKNIEKKLKAYEDSKKNKDNGDDGMEFRSFLAHQLPKLRAFTHEVLRLTTPYPFTMGNKARIVGESLLLNVKQNKNWTDPDNGDEKIVENQYLFEKGTTVYCNLREISRYSEDWIRPNGVCLEHWLNEKNEFVKKDHFLVFSNGRRDCIGKMIALKQLFLLFGSLLWQYQFEFPKKLKMHETIEDIKNDNDDNNDDDTLESKQTQETKEEESQAPKKSEKMVAREKLRKYNRKLSKMKEKYKNESFSLDKLRTFEDGVWKVVPGIDLIVKKR